MTALCIKPACGDNCCGCNNALTEEQVAQYAKRYAWLRDRLIGADFNWNETGASALIFELPTEAKVSADCDKTIDAAMTLTPNVKVSGPAQE